MATFPLAGCLLGFLCYNFNPATIFLGDSGSMVIGFLLGCYGVLWTQKSATLLSMVAPLMALSLPLLDVTLCIIRRALRNQPIFQADRGHIHHRLLDKGLTPRRAVLILYGVCGLGASLALLQSVLHARFTAVVLLVFLAATWFGIRRLGYSEFTLARRLLFGGDFQRTVDTQLHLHRFEQAVQSAQTLAECWDAVREAAGRLGFFHVELHFDGRTFHEHFSGSEAECFLVRVPLTAGNYLVLEREFQSSTMPTSVARFANLLHGVLGPRLWEFEQTLSAAASCDSGTERRF
jgi:UDP-GlcNAc:undecaprenyl-phosphate GlcNAc-1-phosphate transferase